MSGCPLGLYHPLEADECCEGFAYDMLVAEHSQCTPHSVVVFAFPAQFLFWNGYDFFCFCSGSVFAPVHAVFFSTGQTQSLDFRLQQLQRLKQAILDNQTAIIEAAKADLGKPSFEGYFEIATLSEINLALKCLSKWARPRRTIPPVEQWPAMAWVQPEPLGVVLILGAWNYPFQLLMSPLVGAIAAGNCAILKPSEYAPHTAQVVQHIVESCFEPHYVAVVNGDAQVSQALVAEPFDHIFFTGGTETGRAVLAAAAQNLTPVTLELGGKSPCLVDTDIHLDSTARRIVWGKFINVGQTCVAPDYVLVHQKVKQALVERLIHYIREFYGEDPSISPDYGRIVNEKQFRRLAALLPTGRTVIGGQSNADNLYIAPTLFEPVDWADPIMQSEIFGPILPILTYTDLDTAIAQINQRPKPLALYFFSRDRRKQRQVLRSTTSGTVCLNDTVLQYTVSGLPFGGVGGSGMGSYHGKASFETFSHYKSILSRSFALDLNWRYAPYTAAKFNFLKRFITGQWL